MNVQEFKFKNTLAGLNQLFYFFRDCHYRKTGQTQRLPLSHHYLNETT